MKVVIMRKGNAVKPPAQKSDWKAIARADRMTEGSRLRSGKRSWKPTRKAQVLNRRDGPEEWRFRKRENLRKFERYKPFKHIDIGFRDKKTYESVRTNALKSIMDSMEEHREKITPEEVERRFMQMLERQAETKYDMMEMIDGMMRRDWRIIRSDK